MMHFIGVVCVMLTVFAVVGGLVSAPFLIFDKLNRDSRERGIPYAQRPGAQLAAVLLMGAIVALYWFGYTHGGPFTEAAK